MICVINTVAIYSDVQFMLLLEESSRETTATQTASSC